MFGPPEQGWRTLLGPGPTRSPSCLPVSFSRRSLWNVLPPLTCHPSPCTSCSFAIICHRLHNFTDSLSVISLLDRRQQGILLSCVKFSFCIYEIFHEKNQFLQCFCVYWLKVQFPPGENGSIAIGNDSMLLFWYFLWKSHFCPKRSKISLAWAFRLTHPHIRKWSGLTHKEIIREPFAEFQQNREARDVR